MSKQGCPWSKWAKLTLSVPTAVALLALCVVLGERGLSRWFSLIFLWKALLWKMSIKIKYECMNVCECKLVLCLFLICLMISLQLQTNKRWMVINPGWDSLTELPSLQKRRSKCRPGFINSYKMIYFTTFIQIEN